MAERLDAPSSTKSSDYSERYYQAHLGSSEDYSWESPSWREFFTNAASHLIAVANPSSVLDVGCARGLLVQAFVSKGIDAHGIDISTHAIESADPAIRERLSVSSADKITGSWDLITCVEVVEHMSPAEAEAAIDAMCATSDRIMISSGPGDFAEPTHINVRPAEAWAAAFAERGFFRRTDVDLSFLTPWAVLFERSTPTIRDLVYRYEQWAYPMRTEVLEKRAALLEAFRKASADGGTEQLASQLAEAVDRQAQAEARADELSRELELSREQVRQLEHDRLTIRDHIIGLEAGEGRRKTEEQALRRDYAKALDKIHELSQSHHELSQMNHASTMLSHELSQQLNLVRASRSWRIGRALTRPFQPFRRKHL